MPQLPDLTAYDANQTRRIEQVLLMIEGSTCPMAVVDYLGRADGDGKVTTKSDLRRRFGSRDMRHVEIYGLKVVALNPAAQKVAA